MTIAEPEVVAGHSPAMGCMTGRAFRPSHEIAALMASVGADRADRHITYCAGGIFATVDAFWLHQLGHESVSVYDNSMSEWGPDTTLPIERD